MISLRQVRKSFGRFEAVRGVNLEVPKGQIVGILGPNGAGKTTTVRMIAAAIPPTEGEIRVAGLDAVEQGLQVRRKLGYLPESAPLYREMRVIDFLRYRAGLHGISGRARAEAIERAVGQCQLESVRRRRCGILSKGFRQRVGLASVLLHDPDVLILDEPTSGLDPAQIAETRSLIRGLAGSRTMLLVSHILPEVEKSCDRIILFAHGRVQADGSPEQLMQQGSAAGRYTIEAGSDAGTGPAPSTVLGALAGVESVEASEIEGGWQRCTLTFSKGVADQREVIARAAAGAGLVVRELRPHIASLEDLYLRLIAESDGPEVAPGCAPAERPGGQA